MRSPRIALMAMVGAIGIVLPVTSPAPDAARQSTELAALWLVPAADATPPLAIALEALEAGDANRAAGLLEPAVSDPVVGRHVRVHLARARVQLDQPGAAASLASGVIDEGGDGVLAESARWVLADALEAAGDWTAAAGVLAWLSEHSTADRPAAYARLAEAAERAGDAGLAARARVTLYYEFPLSDAAGRLADVAAVVAAVPVEDRLARDLERAYRLFDGGRHAAARDALLALRPRLEGDARDLADLRLGTSHVRTGRYGEARSVLARLAGRAGPHQVEAAFQDLGALRGLGRHAEYETAARAFVEAHPGDPLAERALDDLGTHLIVNDEDGRAAAVFAESYARYPEGAFAARAAWKAGWWAYREGRFEDTIRFFEPATASFPRADYRPSWLYWTARAHEQRGRIDEAVATYARAVLDYRNSYYGREATRRLEGLAVRLPAAAEALAGTARPAGVQVTPGPAPANTTLVRALLASGLYADAVAELRRATAGAVVPPVVDATVAWALNRLGDLRPGITAMRRAYPQFMASGGERLPLEIRRVIFPVAYWDLLRRYAGVHGLDPHLLAAQVAQESTFQADVRSAADAWGLMQILPSTGRRFAGRLGLSGFTTASLTDPETNVRIGTTYLAELVAMFDDVAPALAAYNAGERRVAEWLAERPRLPRDEFIDDIPFPETQFYVKRVIGTADDYRDLYPIDAAPGRP